MIKWNVHFCSTLVNMGVLFIQKVYLFLLKKYYSNLKIYNIPNIFANNMHC